ncbi:MAG: prolipoprotein diacylglyceryl transferase [Parachlamydiales bacterium]|nr:prolipoprotein diacylglyceryl transferase [Parachlamydiales bacterium]
MTLLNYIVWDPSRVFFYIPYIHHPVTYYGLLFAAGFLLAFYRQRVWLKTLIPPVQANLLVDRLAWFLILGTIIGARLVHVFFYDWPYYADRPDQIFAIWNGGLASHGGVLGILIALGFFRLSIKKKYPKLTYLTWLDGLSLSTPIMACCIRLGNFVNQEIIGEQTKLPWGVIFLHPAEAVSVVPRHPVQLYEALFYILIFFGLIVLWDKVKDRWNHGKLAGLFLVLLFTFRFFIDFLKLPQEVGQPILGMHMGQTLSLPLIALGLILFFRPKQKKFPN